VMCECEWKSEGISVLMFDQGSTRCGSVFVGFKGLRGYKSSQYNNLFQVVSVRYFTCSNPGGG
jgi:hypothetical protein